MWMTVALHNVLKLRKVRLLTFICFFFNLSRYVWLLCVYSISKCVLASESQFCQKGICNFLKDLMKSANKFKDIAIQQLGFCLLEYTPLHRFVFVTLFQQHFAVFGV